MPPCSQTSNKECITLSWYKSISPICCKDHKDISHGSAVVHRALRLQSEWSHHQTSMGLLSQVSATNPCPLIRFAGPNRAPCISKIPSHKQETLRAVTASSIAMAEDDTNAHQISSYYCMRCRPCPTISRQSRTSHSRKTWKHSRNSHTCFAVSLVKASQLYNFLLVWPKRSWKSLGKVTAVSNRIFYRNIHDLSSFSPCKISFTSPPKPHVDD